MKVFDHHVAHVLGGARQVRVDQAACLSARIQLGALQRVGQFGLADDAVVGRNDPAGALPSGPVKDLHGAPRGGVLVDELGDPPATGALHAVKGTPPHRLSTTKGGNLVKLLEAGVEPVQHGPIRGQFRLAFDGGHLLGGLSVRPTAGEHGGRAGGEHAVKAAELFRGGAGALHGAGNVRGLRDQLFAGEL